MILVDTGGIPDFLSCSRVIHGACALSFLPSGSSRRDVSTRPPKHFDGGLTVSILRNSLPLTPFHCRALEHFDTSPVSTGQRQEAAYRRQKSEMQRPRNLNALWRKTSEPGCNPKEIKPN